MTLYNMSTRQGNGYFGYSMSNNAVAAYNDGEMPMSKWTKRALVNRVSYLNNEFTPSILNKLTLANLKELFLSYSSSHHTSKFYNLTDFYEVNEDELEEITLEQINEKTLEQEAEKRARREEIAQRTPEEKAIIKQIRAEEKRKKEAKRKEEEEKRKILEELKKKREQEYYESELKSLIGYSPFINDFSKDFLLELHKNELDKLDFIKRHAWMLYFIREEFKRPTDFFKFIYDGENIKEYKNLAIERQKKSKKNKNK